MPGTPVISVSKAKAHAFDSRHYHVDEWKRETGTLCALQGTHTHIPASFNSAQPVDLSRQLKFLATTKLFSNIAYGIRSFWGELFEGKSVRVRLLLLARWTDKARSFLCMFITHLICNNLKSVYWVIKDCTQWTHFICVTQSDHKNRIRPKWNRVMCASQLYHPRIPFKIVWRSRNIHAYQT